MLAEQGMDALSSVSAFNLVYVTANMVASELSQHIHIAGVTIYSTLILFVMLAVKVQGYDCSPHCLHYHLTHNEVRVSG